jgi:hypothetical protein
MFAGRDDQARSAFLNGAARRDGCSVSRETAISR